MKALLTKEENKQILWFYNSAVALGQAPRGVTGIYSHSQHSTWENILKIIQIQWNYKGKMQIAAFFSQMCLPTPDLHFKPVQQLQDLAEHGAVQGEEMEK